MNPLQIIPSYAWLPGILLAAVALAVLLRRTRPAARAGKPGAARARLGWKGWLRLSGFALASLVLLLLGLVVLTNIQQLNGEIAPAQRVVDLPADAGIDVEEVRFAGAQDTSFSGWYVPSQNGASVILLHGYGGTRLDMLWHAQTLVQAGYGVLLYDERASGESEGSRRSYGWEDGPDVGGAIAFLRSREPAHTLQVGIAGCSIGAQIAVHATVRYPEIRAVWADGTANLRAADYPPPRSLLSGLVKASDSLLDAMYVLRLGIPAPPPLIEQIGLVAPRPLMLVGGGSELDFFGSEADRVQHFASHAGPATQTWIIPEAVHCDGPQKQPQEYARRLVAFFDAAFENER